MSNCSSVSHTTVVLRGASTNGIFVWMCFCALLEKAYETDIPASLSEGVLLFKSLYRPDIGTAGIFRPSQGFVAPSRPRKLKNHSEQPTGDTGSIGKRYCVALDSLSRVFMLYSALPKTILYATEHNRPRKSNNDRALARHWRTREASCVAENSYSHPPTPRL